MSFIASSLIGKDGVEQNVAALQVLQYEIEQQTKHVFDLSLRNRNLGSLLPAHNMMA